MSLKSDGENLLKEHNDLYNELIKIPEHRELTFRIDDQDGEKIGKPRFKPPMYTWDSDLLARLRNHLQDIWNFFDTYSYWFDDTIKPIITIDDRRMDKKSVIFLLQNDIYKTDEVYGDYLIEKDKDLHTISYFRRNQRRQTFQPKVNSDDEIENWICSDARKQIIDQFDFLWSYLQTEIETCLKEDYFKIPVEFLTPEYIIEQTKNIADVIEKYPELALLNMGRLSELYLLQALKLKRKPEKTNLAWKAKNDGLLTPQQAKIFDSIRKEYNGLKHRLTYTINKTKIEQLYKNFSTIINNK